MKKKDKHTKGNIQYYNNFASRYKNSNLLQFDTAADYQLKKIIERLDLTKKRNIIELGAGIGRYSLALAKMGHTVTAVDVSAESLELLRRQAQKNRLTKNITLLCNDFSHVVFEKRYDIALCISTYHVLSETEQGRIAIFANFLTSLKSGGTLLLIEPNPFNPLLYFFYLFYPGVQRRNILSFLTSSPLRLKRVLSNLEMTDFDIRYVGFLPLRFMRKSSIVMTINEIINKIPLLNMMSAFSYITAVKK